MPGTQADASNPSFPAPGVASDHTSNSSYWQIQPPTEKRMGVWTPGLQWRWRASKANEMFARAC